MARVIGYLRFWCRKCLETTVHEVATQLGQETRECLRCHRFSIEEAGS